MEFSFENEVQNKIQHLFLDFFSLCPQVRFVRPVTEYASLHSKSLCKNVAHVSGWGNNVHPLSCGGTNAKNPFFYRGLYHSDMSADQGVNRMKNNHGQFLLRIRVIFKFLLPEIRLFTIESSMIRI